MSDLIKHQLANAPIGQLGRDSVTLIQKLEAENASLKEKLKVAKTILEMVEDHRKMPHPHFSAYEKLCCLTERARECLEKIQEDGK